MNGKNGEGYSDPTATKAIKNAQKMPQPVYEVYKVLNSAAGLLGYEIIGIRDKSTKREWRR